MKIEFSFSEITVTGEVPKDSKRENVIASCLNDWTCCMAGGDIPDNFGKGMASASEFLDTSVTPDNLSKLADEIINKK